MALYHFHVAQVSRGAGQSAVASAAYRAGEKLNDTYYGEVHDYTKKGGVIMSEILLPAHAPERFIDRETLWNEVEQAEKNPKSQLAYSFDFALQNELSLDENVRIAREFIEANFVERGMICDMAIHEPGKSPDDIPNPHVHVLVPMRPLKEDGTWGTKQHREYIIDEDGNRVKGPDGKYLFNAVKNTDWGAPETLDLWRSNWAKKVNEAFEKNGITARIDNRSFVDQGLDLFPQVHEGPTVRAMEKKGLKTDKGEWNRFIKAINGAIRKILGTFKSVLNDIEDMQREEAKARTERAEKNKDFMDAISEYEQEIRQKYTYARGKLASKKVLDLYSFISVNRIKDLDDFKDYAGVMYSKVSEISHEARKWDAKVNECDRQLALFEDLKRWTPIYKEWYAISEQRKKKAYASQHEPQLNAYHRAKRELTKLYPDLKVPVKKLMKEREAYKANARNLCYKLDHYKKAAKQAYAFQKQVCDAHRERKRTAEERS